MLTIEPRPGIGHVVTKSDLVFRSFGLFIRKIFGEGTNIWAVVAFRDSRISRCSVSSHGERRSTNLHSEKRRLRDISVLAHLFTLKIFTKFSTMITRNIVFRVVNDNTAMSHVLVRIHPLRTVSGICRGVNSLGTWGQHFSTSKFLRYFGIGVVAPYENICYLYCSLYDLTSLAIDSG